MRKDNSFENRLYESRIIPFYDGSSATEIIFRLLQYKADDPSQEIHYSYLRAAELRMK